uniref:Cytochrome b5 heme-binding domain-containing protein n=1 Tax=Lotharella globosa TaxID=91324 RepID=A0A7S4E0X2_9EUKA
MIHRTQDAWCSVAGHVLNLTSLIKGEKRHPGGVKILEKFAGKDATSQFQMFHYPRYHHVHNTTRNGCSRKQSRDSFVDSLLSEALPFFPVVFYGITKIHFRCVTTGARR